MIKGIINYSVLNLLYILFCTDMSNIGGYKKLQKVLTTNLSLCPAF